MPKDFDGWNRIKKNLDGVHNPVNFREREIWWCSIGVNVGHEQNGGGTHYRRPVLILRKFNRWLFIGVPLSLQSKPNNPYYYPFTVGGIKRSAILSQVRLWDSRRLESRLVKVPEHTFGKIKTAVKAIL